MPPPVPPPAPPPKPPPPRRHPPWPPRRLGLPLQGALPLEPTEADVLAEVRRIWLERPRLRRQFDTWEALMACPRRRHLLMVCARQALKARARAQG